MLVFDLINVINVRFDYKLMYEIEMDYDFFEVYVVKEDGMKMLVD